MSQDGAVNELGDFLRARRQGLDPVAAGLPLPGGRRRVNGLRREEVAQLASISPDFYARLEQGRRRASEPVLAALAQVLHLNDDERRYLFELAGKETGRASAQEQKVQPELQRLLDDFTYVPAIVLGSYTTILGWNPLAAALYLDFGRYPPSERNFLWLLLREPYFRKLYVDWEDMTRGCVEQVRMEAARRPDDPRLADLIARLSPVDANFRRWWADHGVAAHSVGTKLFRHPVVGDLSLQWSNLVSAFEPDQQLVTLTAEPGTPSHIGLRRLAAG
ncbi:helix-turn-helix domain-containing protein [Kineosporia babensis]|uniref:helix-turn-helix domain-containing protein n=1 Tax=Kineosporia babensis TaxID=499548 RepID=UPI0038B28A81